LRRTEEDPRRQEVASLFRSLGNPNRLAILGALLDGERSVGELESNLGIRQPILSQQLAILREAGLLETTRDRKSIVYRLAETHAGAIARLLRAALDPGAQETGPVPAPARKLRSEPFVAAAVFARVEPATGG
jgi:DNA-binding transcriptional ArsR family regulator